ncbi:spore cortex biosynthesis protein YabQ [Acetivibrio ethanolgignens]|nr:spore cortex biosynthesis protein YabQ [Acetivibrio ethanolgignens]
MSEIIVLEVRFFLGSFLGGVILLAVYDILRLIRRIIPHKRIWINGEDLLFWLAASVFIFRIIYRLNNGEIRGFGMLSMTAGMVLYHFTVSDVLVELFFRIFGTSLLKFVQIVKKGLKKAVRPFKMGLKRLKHMQGLHRNEEENEVGQADKKKC